MRSQMDRLLGDGHIADSGALKEEAAEILGIRQTHPDSFYNLSKRKQTLIILTEEA